jgi:hypothetical protein
MLNTFKSKKIKHAQKTKLIVHADFCFWFVELLEFFGAFLNILSINDGFSSTQIKLPQCHWQNI